MYTPKIYNRSQPLLKIIPIASDVVSLSVVWLDTADIAVLYWNRQYDRLLTRYSR